MKTKKIALIDSVGSRAGMDHYNQSLLSALLENQVEPYLYSDSEWTEHPENSFRFFPAPRISPLFRLALLPFRYIKAIHHAKKRECSSIIFHIFHFSILDEWVLRKIKKADMQLILIVHDVQSFIRTTNIVRLQRICEELADVLIVHNQFTRDELTKLISSEAQNKIAIIPHGGFLSLVWQGPDKKTAREALGLDKEKTVVLFFGMIKPNKGLDTLLRSWKLLNSSPSLVIAGRLRHLSFAPYQKMIDEELTDTDIKLSLRQIPNPERDLLFRSADIIVLPYTHIYQSGVLLLAMSYGIPVIASRLKAFEEIIENDVNGLLVDPEDANGLAHAIDKLATDPSLRKLLSENALETIRAHHDWKKIAIQFTSLIS